MIMLTRSESSSAVESTAPFGSDRVSNDLGVTGGGFAMRATLEERFWAKVDRRGDEECWPWLGASRTRNYGIIWDNGRKRLATHVSWELYYARFFPHPLLACHHCDNPPCVNPRHLFTGTMSDNIRDAVQKGRVVPPPGGLANAAKTHCKHGHSLTGDNVRHYSGGRWRQCRTCNKKLDEGRKR